MKYLRREFSSLFFWLMWIASLKDASLHWLLSFSFLICEHLEGNLPIWSSLLTWRPRIDPKLILKLPLILGEHWRIVWILSDHRWLPLDCRHLTDLAHLLCDSCTLRHIGLRMHPRSETACGAILAQDVNIWILSEVKKTTLGARRLFVKIWLVKTSGQDVVGARIPVVISWNLAEVAKVDWQAIVAWVVA